jgi:rhodanese-related sulfurtransferase
MNHETHTNSLDVLIVYDSLRSGKRAKELCDRLERHLAPDRTLNSSVWSLSALQLPGLAQAAASEAEHAALLIVAVNGDKTLPQPVRNWLYWCARGIRAADGALVALLHGILKVNEKLCPAYGCLRQVAYYNGIRFFSEVVDLAEDELDYLLEASHGRAQPNTSLMDTILLGQQDHNPRLL